VRPYLRPIPLFKCLPSDAQLAIAAKLVHRQLTRGEPLDLRGEHANVLCIVTEGKVQVKTHLAVDQVLTSELAAGQWTGEAAITGWQQAVRTSLTTSEERAGILLLWQQDLMVDPTLKIPVFLLRTLSAILIRWGWFLEETASVITGILRFLVSGALEHPVATGILTALVCFMGYLFLTPPGKVLQADWYYLRMQNQALPAEWGQAGLPGYFLDLVPDHPMGTVLQGNFAVQSGDFEGAMRRYQEVAQVNGAGANNLAVLLLAKHDATAAVEWLTLSIQMEPDIAIAHQNLGLAYRELGRRQDAVRAFKEALRLDPGLTVARYHLGMDYLSQDAYVMAGSAFERVLEQDASCAAAYLGLGLVQMQIGDLRRAKDAFHRATLLAPDSIVARFYLGRSQAETKDVVQARMTLAGLLAQNPPESLARRVNIMLVELENEELEEDPMSDEP
jgi:tetratricopeptide (TPR) repeat protein